MEKEYNNFQMEINIQVNTPMANLMVKVNTIGAMVILTKAHSNKVQDQVSVK